MNSTNRSGSAQTGGGRIGLAVAGSIASGLVLGTLLVLVGFAGGTETQVTGSALVALGAGFALLAGSSRRLTAFPQAWALPAGAATAGVGLAVLLLAPGERALELAGWVWPVLLLVLVGWSLRGARRSLPRRSRRWVLVPALGVLVLVAAGGAYETVAAATGPSLPPAGRTYLVDGQQLYLRCSGSGSPAVVLFNGLGERATSWASVQRRVAVSTRVCVFDRPGQGWSGGEHRRRDGRELAASARGLLRAAGVAPPYVLAGHSVGGVYALVYADRYPEDVAGVALIDSATPDQFELPDYPGFYSMWRRVSAVLPSLSRAGITRILGLGAPREVLADRDELAELPTVFRQAQPLETLGTRPLVVLTAGTGAQEGWFEAQDALARLSSDSVHLTLAGATHSALLDEQYAAVTGLAIGKVVRIVRAARLGSPR